MTAAIALRDILKLIRQPWWIAVTLVQPVIWLLLFGALFERVTEIPGFGSDDYIAFLVPGIVVMTAVFSAGWGGMGTIEDLDKGVLDRFLVTPVPRWPLIAGRLVHGAISIAIQTAIITLLAVATGASLDGGVLGVLLLTAIAILLGAGFGAASHGIALHVRKEESLIGILQFVMLPLTFLSTAFMQAELVPGWIGRVADFNPVDWAVVAGREAMSGSPDWADVALRTGLLAAFALACGAFAVRALAAYAKSA